MQNVLKKFEKYSGLYIARKPLSKYRNDFIDEMALNLISQSSGVLHIGAHVGQESATYRALKKPAIFIEADPKIFKILESNISPYSDQIALNTLLGDFDGEHPFHIASNDGQSSSILKFSRSGSFNSVETIEVQTLPMKRLDSVFNIKEIEKYDFWVVDVQGAEMSVLKGAGELLDFVKVLYVEVSTIALYEGGTQWADLCVFLRDRGFKHLITPGDSRHLNIIFVRN